MVRVSVVLAALASVAHADPGTITGTVTYEGTPATPPQQARDVDPKCPQHVTDDALVVDHGKVAGALVRIANGTMGKHAAPATPVVIDQRGCSYSPRVVGIIAGQKLVVRNSDKTFHNVWGVLADKSLFNQGQGPGAPELTVDPSAAKPGDVVEIKCGVHAWMHAYAVVQDHPWFAVTDDKGTFHFEGLAIGTYTLESWHPVLGTRTLKVEIGKGARGKVTARLSYKPS